MTPDRIEHDLIAGPFTIRHVRWRHESALPTHIHDEARIVVALRGTFAERRGPVEREYARGAVIVRAPREPHSDRYAAAGGAYVRVALGDPALANRICDPVLAFGHDARSAAAVTIATRLRDELIAIDRWSDLTAQGLVFELLATFERHTVPCTITPAWISTIRDLFHDDYRTTWSLEDLAHIVDVTPAHLSRTFRRCTGIGISEELRRVRVARARRLIAGSDRPLAAIAAETGFADQSHLTRSFRRVLGITPGAFRRRALRAPNGSNEAVSF